MSFFILTFVVETKSQPIRAGSHWTDSLSQFIYVTDEETDWERLGLAQYPTVVTCIFLLHLLSLWCHSLIGPCFKGLCGTVTSFSSLLLFHRSWVSGSSSSNLLVNTIVCGSGHKISFSGVKYSLSLTHPFKPALCPHVPEIKSSPVFSMPWMHNVPLFFPTFLHEVSPCLCSLLLSLASYWSALQSLVFLCCYVFQTRKRITQSQSAFLRLLCWSFLVSCRWPYRMDAARLMMEPLDQQMVGSFFCPLAHWFIQQINFLLADTLAPSRHLDLGWNPQWGFSESLFFF